MKRNTLIITLLMLVLMLCLTACGGEEPATEAPAPEAPGEEPAEEQQVFNWIMYNYMTNEATATKIDKQWAEELYELTDGRLNITVQTQGELPFSGNEMLQVLADNSVQMADLGAGYMGGQCEYVNITMLPYLVSNLDDAYACDEALAPYSDKYLSETFGVKTLFTYQYPGQFIWGSGEAPTCFADLKNRKIRTYAVQQQTFLQQFSAVPVALTWAEVPDALNRGIIEGMVTSAMGVMDAQLHEALDWVYLANMGPGLNWVLVSEDAFNELPADLQEIFLASAEKYHNLLNETMFNEDIGYQERAASEGGIQMIEPTDEDMQIAYDAAAIVIEEYAASVDSDVAQALQDVRDALGK